MVRRDGTMSAVLGAGVLVLLTGCLQSAATAESEPQQPTPPAQPEPPPCKATSVADPAASFPGARCGWLLEDREGALRLQSLDLDPPPAAVGAVPEPCAERPCVYEGFETSVGPLVLARITSAHSEVPDGVLLGVAAGQSLAFIDLWAGAGPPVVSDGTEIGPAHALVPHDCGGQLGLLVVPRLDPGERTEPPVELRAREGIYAPTPKGLEQRPVDRSTCEPLKSVPIP